MKKTDSEIEELDKQLKDAGMITLSECLNSSTNQLFLHKGVDDLEKFEQWLDMRYTEMMKMKSRMLLKNKDNEELYEWVLSYVAVLGEVRNQYKYCKKSQ